MQMGDHVSQRLYIDVIGTHGPRNRALGDEEVCAERLPLVRREMIRAGGMAQIEYQEALTSIGLVLGQIERRNRKRRDEVPMLA